MSVYDNLVGMEEVLDEFVVETTELLEGVNEDLVNLESGGDDDLVNRVFRAFHTIKGTCGFLGFIQAKDVAHVAEDLLNQLRNGETQPHGGMIDVLLETCDWMGVFLEDVKERKEQEYETEPLIERLRAANNGQAKAEAAEPEPAQPEAAAQAEVEETQPEAATEEATPAEPEQADLDRAVEGSQPVSNGQELEPAAEVSEPTEADSPAAEETEAEELAVAGEVQPETKDEDQTHAEPTEAPTDASPQPEVNGTSSPEAPPAAAEPSTTEKNGKPAASSSSQTIRVDMERLENLMNLAGELVLSRNQLGQAYTNLTVSRNGDASLDNLDQVNNALGRVTTEIQEAVMQMRMLPISNVFRRFPRVVRDLARLREKQVSLELIGEETELDRSVIEAIGDPLLHLVRNSVDHGIESPEDRKAAGKNPEGRVVLRASHEGNHIVIEVEDDGGGINADKLVKKAIEKGTLTPAEAESLSYRERLNLIFRAGFSTAEQVTDVSGRGVGMDVVHTNISKLNGVIDVDTKMGQGTRITIKLPLTLAIVTGLKVNVHDEEYVVPFTSIIETVKIGDEDLTQVENKWVIRFRDAVVPTLFLDEWFQVPQKEDTHKERYAVIVAVAEFRYALVVTGMQGQEEAVIKPLGQSLGRIPGIAGGTIGGDGLITLILDVPELIYSMGMA
jgi:two-component system chemotaxis sensor kinase CheA